MGEETGEIEWERARGKDRVGESERGKAGGGGER